MNDRTTAVGRAMWFAIDGSKPYVIMLNCNCMIRMVARNEETYLSLIEENDVS